MEVLGLFLSCRAARPAAEFTSQGRVGLVGPERPNVPRGLLIAEGPRVAKELKVVADFYEFMVWVLHHTEKFPRHHRYSLGRDIEARLQIILSLLLRAKYAKAKTAHLTDANVELEILRFQLRLATDLGVLPRKSHRCAAQHIMSLGSQIGGWLNSRSR